MILLLQIERGRIEMEDFAETRMTGMIMYVMARKKIRKML